MKKYFNQQYRIPSNRLQGYDYSSDGAYFITVCTWNRIQYLGKIEEGKDTIALSEMGKILLDEWFKTPIIRKNISLGAFQVMPNHFHGIIKIGNPVLPERINNPVCHVPNTPGYKNSFGPQNKTIGRIMSGIKSACKTRIINEGFKTFQWQKNFHDHIIRDWNSYRIISKYITNNVRTWKDDKYYSDG